VSEPGGPVTASLSLPRQEAAAPRRRRERDRTAVRRLPEKQVRDRSALDEMLDAALVAHVAVLDDGRPYVVPMGCARDRDELLVHGSTAARSFRALAAGLPTCATVTLLDGVTVARSQFESSMQYRCAMVLGSFEVLHGKAKERALGVLAARLLPGLEGARTPSAKELVATAVLALPLDEWSLKVSDGCGEDAPGDLERPVWAGVIPMLHSWGAPVPAPDLALGIPAPAAIASWPTGRA
jgi:nitroimidazol reductase NimA-like FMN-containing flavoprotein (pyridoxamine 5'-phosphate oxidase superfamily)